MTALLAALACTAASDDLWITLPGQDAAAQRIVLVSGDEEYRSEEMLPQLARILNRHHGFHCTVHFAIDPATGRVQPNISNIPGLESLAQADLLVLFVRLRDLPDDQMKHLADYVEAKKPIVAIRTATHAFVNRHSKQFGHFSSSSKQPGWEGGFGKRILGETWVAHHGAHGKEGTRGRLVKEQREHLILKGIEDGAIFGPSDVYRVNLPLPEDSTPLVLGEVTTTLKPDSLAVEGAKNDPMMPIAWTRNFESRRTFVTTMGCSQDFENEAFRRLLVNACFWGLDRAVPDKAAVEIVGNYEASPYRFKKDAEWKPGKRPAEYFPE